MLLLQITKKLCFGTIIYAHLIKERGGSLTPWLKSMVSPTPGAEVAELGIHSYPGQHSESPCQMERGKQADGVFVPCSAQGGARCQVSQGSNIGPSLLSSAPCWSPRTSNGQRENG